MSRCPDVSTSTWSARTKTCPPSTGSSVKARSPYCWENFPSAVSASAIDPTSLALGDRQPPKVHPLDRWRVGQSPQNAHSTRAPFRRVDGKLRRCRYVGLREPSAGVQRAGRAPGDAGKLAGQLRPGPDRSTGVSSAVPRAAYRTPKPRLGERIGEAGVAFSGLTALSGTFLRWSAR